MRILVSHLLYYFCICLFLYFFVVATFDVFLPFRQPAIWQINIVVVVVVLHRKYSNVEAFVFNSAYHADETSPRRLDSNYYVIIYTDGLHVNALYCTARRPATLTGCM